MKYLSDFYRVYYVVCKTMDEKLAQSISLSQFRPTIGCQDRYVPGNVSELPMDERKYYCTAHFRYMSCAAVHKVLQNKT